MSTKLGCSRISCRDKMNSSVSPLPGSCRESPSRNIASRLVTAASAMSNSTCGIAAASSTRSRMKSVIPNRFILMIVVPMTSQFCCTNTSSAAESCLYFRIDFLFGLAPRAVTVLCSRAHRPTGLFGRSSPTRARIVSWSATVDEPCSRPRFERIREYNRLVLTIFSVS